MIDSNNPTQKMSNQERVAYCKNKYEGVVFKSENYGEFIITKYNNALDVDIKFLKTNFESKIEISQARKGKVKDYSLPLVRNIGIVGRRIKKGESKIIIDTWNNMLGRVYCESYLNKNTSYKKVTIHKEWLCFSNFEKWYLKNKPKNKNIKYNLDKDLLSGKHLIYSPSTCCFLPEEINLAIRKNIKNRKSNAIILADKYKNDISKKVYKALLKL